MGFRKLTVDEEELVCHSIRETSKNVATAEVRITVFTSDGREFQTVTSVELYCDDD